MKEILDNYMIISSHLLKKMLKSNLVKKIGNRVCIVMRDIVKILVIYIRPCSVYSMADGSRQGFFPSSEEKSKK